MKRIANITRVLIWVAAFVSLVPLGRMVTDWIALNRVLSGTTVQMTGRSFDWIHWTEDDGIISAAYVPPLGPAAQAGIQDGDVFFMLEGQQYFNVEDLQRAVEGIEVGASRTYVVQRNGSFVEATVHFTRYPTFLYPLSATLWHFSVWGFFVAGFVHVVGLIIVGPFAFRSRASQYSLLLIAASSLWIFGNFIRLLMVELAGPPMFIGGTYDQVFQALTVVGLTGWIGFPALLIRRVLGDVIPGTTDRVGASKIVVYLPVVILGAAAFITTLRGSMGPITVDGLVAPILFYACCYVGAAGGIMLLRALTPADDPAEVRVAWSRWGSTVMILLALPFGLSILGVVPLFGAVTDTTSGWLIVAAQLLSVVPVAVVSHATLKHGKIGQVLSRGLTYVVVSGTVFFAFVGGLTLMEPYLERLDVSSNVVAGLYAVLLLVGVEWSIRHFRGSGMSLFAAERKGLYRAVQELQEQLRSLLDYDALAQQTVEAVGSTFGARSAVLYIRSGEDADPWISASYNPEAPYVTERVVSLLRPHLTTSRDVWARNPELKEANVPEHLHRLLLERKVALLVPVVARDELIGILALGLKSRRRSVYNLEEVDLLRTLAGQVALAIERLRLFERERALVRETAEAQLVALRAQINPHFLFNALNTIVSLIEERPDEAEEVVEHLAAIFRYVLHTGGSAFVSIADEIELTRHYLSIEQSRFGGSMQVEHQIHPDLRRHPVPAFVVQTLVENAVKHGIGRKRGGGVIRIDCNPLKTGEAEIVIFDSGAGIPQLFDVNQPVTGRQDFFGMGLENVASRLAKLYGRDDLLSIRSDPNEGTAVRVRLPAVHTDGNAALPSALEINARQHRADESFTTSSSLETSDPGETGSGR